MRVDFIFILYEFCGQILGFQVQIDEKNCYLLSNFGSFIKD